MEFKMSKQVMLLCGLSLVASAGLCVADQAQHMSERSTLTGGFWGLNDTLV